MELKSDFTQLHTIPEKYTCDGKDVNPPLEIMNPPKGVQSFALIVDDPDAPIGTYVHWIVFNISPLISFIKPESVPEGGILGMNDFKRLRYGGPCPPTGMHRYYFKLYALKIKLNLKEGAKKAEVEKAMQGNIIEKTELVGIYKRKE